MKKAEICKLVAELDHQPEEKGPLLFKLYVSGQTGRSHAAVSNMRRICEEAFGADYQLEIVDVLKTPDVAEKERIFATPTLVKHNPPPVRRLIGDLSDRERVIQHMGGSEIAGDPRGHES